MPVDNHPPSFVKACPELAEGRDKREILYPPHDIYLLLVVGHWFTVNRRRVVQASVPVGKKGGAELPTTHTQPLPLSVYGERDKRKRGRYAKTGGVTEKCLL